MIKPRTLCAILALLSLSLAGSAQYQPVVFDPGSNLLGNGQPLPAEKQWSITGPVAPDIGIVEARIYEDAAMKHMATKGRWEQTELGNSPSFNINLDQKLRGNAKYTVVLGFQLHRPRSLRHLGHQAERIPWSLRGPKRGRQQQPHPSY
ncbi:MAG: hypothetical protein IPI95_02615 [Flavobacteriales bacterium]|nr:hypothetical protein [Flavobacteriales bacterium]